MCNSLIISFLSPLWCAPPHLVTVWQVSAQRGHWPVCSAHRPSWYRSSSHCWCHRVEFQSKCGPPTPRRRYGLELSAWWGPLAGKSTENDLQKVTRHTHNCLLLYPVCTTLWWMFLVPLPDKITQIWKFHTSHLLNSSNILYYEHWCDFGFHRADAIMTRWACLFPSLEGSLSPLVRLSFLQPTCHEFTHRLFTYTGRRCGFMNGTLQCDVLVVPCDAGVTSGCFS